jgi:hypothetical protein
MSQRQAIVVLIASTMSRATATRAISALDRRASGRPSSASRSQVEASSLPKQNVAGSSPVSRCTPPTTPRAILPSDLERIVSVDAISADAKSTPARLVGLAGPRDGRGDSSSGLRLPGAQRQFGAFGRSRHADRHHDRVA